MDCPLVKQSTFSETFQSFQTFFLVFQNRLASLEATPAQNYDRPSYFILNFTLDLMEFVAKGDHQSEME